MIKREVSLRCGSMPSLSRPQDARSSLCLLLQQLVQLQSQQNNPARLFTCNQPL